MVGFRHVAFLPITPVGSAPTLVMVYLPTRARSFVYKNPRGRRMPYKQVGFYGKTYNKKTKRRSMINPIVRTRTIHRYGLRRLVKRRLRKTYTPAQVARRIVGVRRNLGKY